MEDQTRSMNEADLLFDELVLRIESACFPGRLPQLSVSRLVSVMVTAALAAIPCVAEAEPHVKEWFADKLCLALARRLAAAERREWLN
jgi:hypothetical protein